MLHKIDVYKKIADELGSDAAIFFLFGHQPLSKIVHQLTKRTVDVLVFSNMSLYPDCEPITEGASQHSKVIRLFDNAIDAILRKPTPPLRCKYCKRQVKATVNEIWIE